ncbi:MAG: methyltransferase [Magnetococcales bacterium]|nr:methyltransferase [Magnetococcales bacterium]
MEKQEILNLMRSFQQPEVVMAAHKLGVFDALGDRVLGSFDIASRIGASVRGTTILLDALVGMGLLIKEQGNYKNTATGRASLCSDGNDPIINALNHIGELMESWRKLPESVISGRSNKSEEKTFSKNPEVNSSFIGAMAEIGRPNGRIIAKNINLAGCKMLLDVGGGPGSYSEEILRVNPDMRAIVADLPITIETARHHIEQGGFADRIDFKAADIYNDPNVDLGIGYDVALISNVLHMEGAEKNRRLLQKVHAAMEPNGLLMIHETIIDDDHASPVDRTLFAVNMLVNTERGNCYSFSEMQAWLLESGFVGIEFIDCFEQPSLMLARKVG